MAKAGCEVVVYEAFHEPGGVLKYGIPDFRLPNAVVDVEIDKLKQLGVKFECNTLVGRLFTLEQMITEMGFHALFVGTGAGYPSFMGIPGESLNGVLSANELLTRCNLMRARDFPRFDTPLMPGRRVAVIGSGNTAMDALRVSLRLGAEKVACVYRRSRAEAPARAEELHHAEEEGVEFHWLTSPVEVLGDADKRVRGMRCQKMELGEPDASGRRRPMPVPGSEFELECDSVVYAIGTNANPILGQTSKLKLDSRGYIATDETLATSIAGVYAGGDIVTGAATVIEAMGAGRKAARAMKVWLGLRDTDVVYAPEPARGCRRFGFAPDEHGYARVHLGSAQATTEQRHERRGRSSRRRSPSTSSRSSATRARARSAAASRSVAIAAKTGNGIWTTEIIPAEIQPPARSVAGASGIRIRIGTKPGTNGGDETDLVVAFKNRCCSVACVPGSSRLGRRSCSKTCGASIATRRSWRPMPKRSTC
jgi:glutamate synthase (NADPH/NADH) small chain